MARVELLDVPPVEAVRDFRAKGLHVGHHWRDTDEAQHLISFTAAKAARLDVLQALKDEVDAAIAEGITLETFQDNLEPTLRSLRWWGRERRLDPKTGKTEIVQLGSPQRLRTIFDTNLRMAYSRGRWERIERQARNAPYLRYVAVLDAKTRPDHLRWHGTVLPHDHPFWRTHYPPCGWYCRCTVIQLSEEDLEEFGWEVTGPPDDWNRMRTWIDRRNGKPEGPGAGRDRPRLPVQCRADRRPEGLGRQAHPQDRRRDPGPRPRRRRLARQDSAVPAVRAERNEGIGA